MSSDNGKVSQLPPKARMEAAKERQPKVAVQVTVMLMDNRQVLVQRPECHNQQDFAAVIDLLATGIKLVAQKQAHGADSRIIQAKASDVPGLRG